MPVARIIGGVGRALIVAGLLVLLFVAYQLWGTGLAEARAQDRLRDDFEAVLATTTSSSTTTTTSPPADGEDGEGGASTTTAPPTTQPPAPATPQGEAVALIRIPAAGIDKAVVAGVTVGDLKKGPGHYPTTPLPGRPGNSAIAGHRTTYGAPFGELGDVEAGDEILVTTREGDFRYVVDRISVVSPNRVEVLEQTRESRLTLTTCHPRYSARQRLIVSAVLAGDPPAEAPAAPAEVPADPDPPADEPAIDEPAADDPADDDPVVAAPTPAEPGPTSIDDPSLAGDPTARGPASAWAAATGLVALAGWALGRRWHRVPAYLLALPVGAYTLFQCFEQVARLLPASI